MTFEGRVSGVEEILAADRGDGVVILCLNRGETVLTALPLSGGSQDRAEHPGGRAAGRTFLYFDRRHGLPRVQRGKRRSSGCAHLVDGHGWLGRPELRPAGPQAERRGGGPGFEHGGIARRGRGGRGAGDGRPANGFSRLRLGSDHPEIVRSAGVSAARQRKSLPLPRIWSGPITPLFS